MIDEFRVQFVCENCGDVLPVEEKLEAYFHDEYHDCFAEKVCLIATIEDRRITVTDGIRLEVSEA